MAVDDAESGAATSDADGPDSPSSSPDTPVVVGEYTWQEYLEAYGPAGSSTTLYARQRAAEKEAAESASGWRARKSADDDDGPRQPNAADWAKLASTETAVRDRLGFHPASATEAVEEAATEVVGLDAFFEAFCDPETTPVVKDIWLWEHYKRLYYYEPDGSRPRTETGDIIRFDQSEALGFDCDSLESMLAGGADTAEQLSALVDERTVDIQADFDEDAFFSTDSGATTVANRYDLEKAVPMGKKTHFQEVERYWVNKPYAFVVIFHSSKENETKYYAVEPYRNEIEHEISTYLTGKLRTAIKYGEQGSEAAEESHRRKIIVQETNRLLARYDLYSDGRGDSLGNQLAVLPAALAGRYNGALDRLETVLMSLDEPIGRLEASLSTAGEPPATASVADGTRYGEYLSSRSRPSQTADRPLFHERIMPDRLDPEAYRLEPTPESSVGELLYSLGYEPVTDDPSTAELVAPPTHQLDGIAARPEPAVVAENADTLTEYQVEKLLYYLQRDFIGYERIDPIKHDINVEDISCDGYNSPVFVYHSGYEQIISNIIHGERELDDFVVKLAQRSGKGISKRRPQVDATLPDGSRAQLTLGREVSDHGTNYTIRQFKEVPFTPIDLINWKTFSLDEMAFLWLAIENDKSLIFAGGTASGKTTSLNAVSLFIPSNTKIVSIEDTREVELPQRNWIASVTRPSFTEDDKGDIDEFDLLEAALRQRPDYIVMGEIRGEEGRTLFQVMSTGHTTYTTFHADSVGEVLKRFTTQPINVSKTMFSALDLVSIQTSTRVKGKKVRRNKSLTEINHYDAENDEINVQDIYQWQAEHDEYFEMGASNTLEEIKFDRGWSHEELEDELFERQVVLAYLIDRGLNTYTEVAATLQAYINDPETILALMANESLSASLEDLREMESVLIDVDPDVEALVPRPDPDSDQREEAAEILEEAEPLFEAYRGVDGGSVTDALEEMFVAVDTGDDTETAIVGDDADDKSAVDGNTESVVDGDTEPTARTGAESVVDTGDDTETPVGDDADNPFDAYIAGESADRQAESATETADDASSTSVAAGDTEAVGSDAEDDATTEDDTIAEKDPNSIEGWGFGEVTSADTPTGEDDDESSTES